MAAGLYIPGTLAEEAGWAVVMWASGTVLGTLTAHILGPALTGTELAASAFGVVAVQVSIV